MSNGNQEEFYKEHIKRRNELLQNWLVCKANFEEAKKAELAARKAAVDHINDPSLIGKQQTIELGNGYKAKLKIPIRYTFVKNSNDKADIAEIKKALAAIAQDGAVGQLVAEKLITWSPDLSLTEYSALCPAHKNIIDAVIVTKEGAPVLSIQEPKA